MFENARMFSAPGLQSAATMRLCRWCDQITYVCKGRCTNPDCVSSLSSCLARVRSWFGVIKLGWGMTVGVDSDEN
jgi:hypothetical protein